MSFIPMMEEWKAGGPERARDLPWGTKHALDLSQGFLGTPLRPSPPACFQVVGSWLLRLSCPFSDEFCIVISVLSLSVKTVIYSFLCVSVPRNQVSGPALLPRRPCQSVCLWEYLVPELTGTNKETIFKWCGLHQRDGECRCTLGRVCGGVASIGSRLRGHLAHWASFQSAWSQEASQGQPGRWSSFCRLTSSSPLVAQGSSGTWVECRYPLELGAGSG